MIRYDPKQGKRIWFRAHKIIQDYINKMRGVDRVDRAMADWNVSQKGKNYNYRIFYYGLNAAFANMKVVAC